MRNKYFLLLLALVALAIVSGCTRSVPGEPSTNSKRPGETRTVDPATAAAITGVVEFTGVVPRAAKIDMSADPACKGDNTSEQVVARGGRLQNVFVYVYVKEGAGTGWTFAPHEVVVRQQGCRYAPHVVGIVAGETIRFENADDAMHNIHPLPQSNQEWNTAQMPHGDPLVRKFQNPELLIPVKCNQHPWMKMYVNVVENPFFAVTGMDGSFELKGLPPGTYTIAAVHESLGEQVQQVTVGPKDTKNARFAFSGEKVAALAK